MKLAVYVMGRDVAVLEQAGDFKSVLTYHAGTAPDDFVSLTMPDQARRRLPLRPIQFLSPGG